MHRLNSVQHTNPKIKINNNYNKPSGCARYFSVWTVYSIEKDSKKILNQINWTQMRYVNRTQTVMRYTMEGEKSGTLVHHSWPGYWALKNSLDLNAKKKKMEKKKCWTHIWFLWNTDHNIAWSENKCSEIHCKHWTMDRHVNVLPYRGLHECMVRRKAG